MKYQKKPISSLKSIVKSIEKDPQVYCWFAFLLQNNAINQQLQKTPDQLKKLQSLQRLNLLSSLTLILFLICITFSFFVESFILLGLSLTALIGMIVLNGNKKKIAASLSEHVLLNDFSAQEITHQTLYQITEQLSEKHNVPSLIDTMYRSDDLCRKIFMGLIILLLFIKVFVYPITFRTTGILLIALTCIAYYITNSSLYLLLGHRKNINK